MLEPKFKVGDKVIHRRTGRQLTVVDVLYNKSTVATAIVVLENGTSKLEPSTIREYYSYRLNDGHSWRYAEDLLEAL